MSHSKRFLVLLFSLFSSATIAEPDNRWVEVAKIDENRIYLDVLTLEKIGVGARYWTMTKLHDKTQKKVKPVRLVMRQLKEVDCKAMKERTLYLHATLVIKGRDVEVTEATPWEYVLPQSNGELEARLACKLVNT
jgi:hypothetical protein